MERQVRPKRPDNARITLALLSRVVAWRELLTIVRPDTLIRWHRDLYRLFWRGKSKPRGRPRIPADLQRLIADIAVANRTWGEERIAAELRLKLGLTVSPRTVRRYMPRNRRPSGGRSSWTTFLHNHAGAALACDFCVAVTATFQRLYVFVLLDITPRRILHWNITAHPTAEWTVQQFRNGLPSDTAYRCIVHDRDAIFAPAVDDALGSMSLEVLPTPPRAPQANAYCERFIGTARRECLDWIIPLNERHLRRVLAEWMTHYNAERPHSRWVLGCRTTRNAARLSRDTTSRTDGASFRTRGSVVYTITSRLTGPREFLRSTRLTRATTGYPRQAAWKCPRALHRSVPDRCCSAHSRRQMFRLRGYPATLVG